MVTSAFLGGEEGWHIPAGGFARGWMCLAAAEEEEVMSCTMTGLYHLHRITESFLVISVGRNP